MYCILHCILLSCCKSIHIVGFLVTRDLLVIVQIVRLIGNVRKNRKWIKSSFFFVRHNLMKPTDCKAKEGVGDVICSHLTAV